MRPMPIGRSFLGLLGLLFLLPFNNCGGFQNVSLSDGNSTLNCPTRLCIEPNVNNLNVSANLPSGTTDQRIPAGLVEFNIGGDCNEGGFPYNKISWELWYNGVPVRNSGMFGMKPGSTVDSQCINGRFLLYVNLSLIGADQVNRSGLMINSSGARGNYQLYIEVMGKDSAYDTNTSRRSRKALVNLVPI